MDSTIAFERQVADEALRMAGPSEPVDDASIFRAVSADGSPTWTIRPRLTRARSVVVGIVAAVFGGLVLVAQPLAPQGDPSVGTETMEAGRFRPTGSLAQPRAGHSATLLPDGRVLIVGGERRTSLGSTSAEIWDPDTETFSPTGSLAEGRSAAAATLLRDGRVLVIGGTSEGGLPIRSAEVWDPQTGAFSHAGEMAGGRWHPAATLLPDDRVLVFGNSDTQVPAEIWDPESGVFGPAASLARLEDHSAASLPDGRLLIVSAGEGPGSAELWDPETDTYSSAGTTDLTWVHVVASLPDGRVFVIGDDDESFVAEIWDPVSGTFSRTGWLEGDRGYGTAAALRDGGVLITGGCTFVHDCTDWFASADVWDPESGTFSPAGEMAEARVGHTATVLGDGRVLVVGGHGPDDAYVLATAEIWEPSGA